MTLNLVSHQFAFHSRFGQEPFDLEVVEVGDSSGFHQLLIHQLLRGLPGIQECYFTAEDIAFIVFGETVLPRLQSL